MRTRTIIVVLGLAMVGAVSVASAQVAPPVVPPPALQCSASQLGQPCGLNSYSTCTQTACFHIEDQIDDAGEDVGVPTSCNECTACVQSGCLYTGCPAGSYCTGFGVNPASPLGGWGFGPPSNVDETTIEVPQYLCVDAGPQDLGPPRCPDLNGAATGGGIVGPSPGGGSGGLDAGVARNPPSNDTTTPRTAGGSSVGGTQSLEAGVERPAAPAASADPSHDTDLSRACAMAPGTAAGMGAIGPVGVALGLLAARRRRRRGQA